jgi:two-component system OmpR family response regulator
MGIRVFLVDDVHKTQSTLADLLTTLGDFRVIGSATTEAEANLWLDENAGGWDLAIVDLLLEQGAGLSVIARCRAHSQQGKVVVFSGYATPGVRGRCIELGADAVIDKTDLGAMVHLCTGMAGLAMTG